MRIPVLLVAMASAATCGAAEFFVSPSGNDAAPGTKAKPFATITRARDEVRTLVKAGLKENVTVWLAPGRYEIAEPITFGLQDSGTAQHSITYRGNLEDPSDPSDLSDPSDSGGRATISGGRVIKGWKQNGKFWETTIPEAKQGKWVFRELFVNGKRAQRARHPNAPKVLRVAKVGPDKRTSFQFKAGDVPNLGDWSTVELVWYHDWSITRVSFKSVDMEARNMVTAGWVGPSSKHYAMDSWERNPRYFLENAKEFLDAPGEWFLDASEGTLSYRPRPGEVLEKCEAIAPYAEKLIDIRGNPTNNVPVRNLVFRDLAFEHCFYSPKRYAAGQAGWHEEETKRRTMLPPAINLFIAEHCRFENVRIAHLGGSGIYFGSRCKHCVLTRSLVTDISGNGVMIGESCSRMLPVPSGFKWTSPNKGKTKSWWAEHPYRWINKAPEQAATANVVSDCIIERVGQQYFGAVGIWIAITRQTRIEYNEIRYTPYTGISMGWVWDSFPTASRDNLIQHNHIHHNMQQLSDGGGIYTLGTHFSSKLRKNLIHDVPVNMGRAESNGMFLDEGTTDLTIEENVIYNIAKSPLRFHRARKNLVQKNVLVCGERIPHIRYNNTKPSEITQQDNTIVEEGKGTPVPGVHGGGLSFSGSKGLDVPHSATLDPEKLTVEVWVKLGQLPGDADKRRWVAGKNSNEWVDGHYGIGINGDRVCGFMNIGGGKENAVHVSGKAGTIKPDTWHQLVLTYDGTQAAVYCNGKLSGTRTVNKKRKPGRGTFALGKRPDGHKPVACSIDEVAVFNRALAAGEVAARFKQRGAANAAADESRVGYWGMNETGDSLKEAIAKLMKEVGPRWADPGAERFRVPTSAR